MLTFGSAGSCYLVSLVFTAGGLLVIKVNGKLIFYSVLFMSLIFNTFTFIFSQLTRSQGFSLDWVIMVPLGLLSFGTIFNRLH